jgi:methionyl aminopeptidase
LITLKSEEHLEKMRVAGRIASSVLTYLKPLIVPGISAKKIDLLAEQFIRDNGGVPACHGYKDYPASTCISINEQAVHVIPLETKIIQLGDVVKVDLVVEFDGFHADTCRTFIVPPASPEVTQFVQTCYTALWAAIDKAVEGNTVSDLSNTISDIVLKAGHGVVKEFSGHGIGRNMHEEPSIVNYHMLNKGPALVRGMTLAIEPIITQKPEALIHIEGWNTWSLSGRVSHHEHSVVVGYDNVPPEVLTLREEEKNCA